MERQFFLDNKEYRILATLHEPKINKDVTRKRSSIGIVFCHAFAEEKLISHRVMVNLARKLCFDGYYVLRFDFMGHGDSEGEFEDATIKIWMKDIMNSVSFLYEDKKLQKIGLLGVRFGATLATLAYEENKSIDFLISINPIINGREYIWQCLKSNLSTQMKSFGKIIKTRQKLIQELTEGKKINIDGYIISKEFYEQVKDINLIDNIGNRNEKVILIHICFPKKQQEFNKIYQNLYETYKTNGYDIVVINVIENLFWTDLINYHAEANNLSKIVSKLLADVVYVL